MARARHGGPPCACAAVAWAAPATSGAGVWGPDGRFLAPRERGKGRWSNGGEGERGGGHGAGSYGVDTPRPLADHGAPNRELGPLCRSSSKFDRYNGAGVRQTISEAQVVAGKHLHDGLHTNLADGFGFGVGFMKNRGGAHHLFDEMLEPN